MVRDEEIKRLTNYAKGIGLKVIFSSSKSPRDDAEWAIDNTEITIFKKITSTKINIVLSLIHELGHAVHNIHEKNRKTDAKVERAVDHIDYAEENELDVKKVHRKAMLEHEINGTNYWESIYKETNMKFPFWRLKLQMEFDIWQYEVFYETGSYPGYKERRKKERELKNKYKE